MKAYYQDKGQVHLAVLQVVIVVLCSFIQGLFGHYDEISTPMSFPCRLKDRIL
jgi:hypothetical protein